MLRSGSFVLFYWKKQNLDPFSRTEATQLILRHAIWRQTMYNYSSQVYTYHNIILDLNCCAPEFHDEKVVNLDSRIRFWSHLLKIVPPEKENKLSLQITKKCCENTAIRACVQGQLHTELMTAGTVVYSELIGTVWKDGGLTEEPSHNIYRMFLCSF